MGASVGQTALNVSVGARTRWASIFSGIWMLVFVVLLAPVIEQVPMAVLGALMVFAGATSIQPRDVWSILRTGRSPLLGFLVTLVVSLVASAPLAVVAGVGLAIIMHMVRAGSDVNVRWLTKDDQGNLVEYDPPSVLAADQVTVLTVYGDLFFAGAKELEDVLPSVGPGQRPVAVLRMRGHRQVDATLIDVLNRYAEELADAGGRLYLSGLDEDVVTQLTRSAKLDLGDEVHVVPATPVIGQSTEQAAENGRQWLSAKGIAATAMARDDDDQRALPEPHRIVLPEGALQPPRR